MRMRSTNTYSVTFANGQTEVFTTSRECHFVAAYFCPVADKVQVALWSKTMAAAKALGQFVYGSNKEGKSAKLRLHIFPCTKVSSCVKSA